MYKLTHVIPYTVQSKCFIFAVLERWLIHGVITGCSFFLFFYSLSYAANAGADNKNTSPILYLNPNRSSAFLSVQVPWCCEHLT